jgi:stearoyl-CoA desaturase (delta-9 desaturase)
MTAEDLLQQDVIPEATPKSEKSWTANSIFVVFVHLVSALTFYFYPPATVPWQTWLLTFASWELATLGITAGYHRLWSHRSYKASLPLKILLAWMGTLGFQGSIRWWVLRHRLHHRFTDTENDPYNAKLGFWHCHIGWIFKKSLYSKFKLINMSDLDSDPIVAFQHKYYLPLALLNGIILPALIAHFGWNDFLGGFLYTGYVCRVLVWHVTFSINSFAHLIGSQEFSQSHTAKGGFFIALLTQGEGYHNFHHEFPNDFRNGINWYDYDPTKWLLSFMGTIGLASDLKVTPNDEIEKTKLSASLARIKEEMKHYDFGLEEEQLPVMAKEEVTERSKNGSITMIIDGHVVMPDDDLLNNHPGGRSLLFKYNGLDASKAFNGGLNNHTEHARLWMRKLTVGKLSNRNITKEE